MGNFVADLWKTHPYWVTFGTILASEAIWVVTELFLVLIRKMKEPRRIHEVVFFNELGEQCSSSHYDNRNVEAVGLMDFHDTCDNPHCSKKGIAKMTQQIDQAVYAIDVAIYTFTSVALCEAFKRALQRGVTIRIITDKENVFSSGSQLNALALFGAQVLGPPTTTYLMHHKFLVIDGVDRVEEIKLLKQRKWMQKTRSVLISGSANWTRLGFTGNLENCIITDDKVMAHTFQAEFNRMWNVFESSRSNTSKAG